MLLGRESEFRALAAALESGPGAVVFGEAGVGKTALLRRAAAASGRRTFEGGGARTLDWLPYFPLARALNIAPPGGDAATVTALVAEHVGDGLLLLDDLHWCDRYTLDLLALLAGRVATLTAVRRGDPAAPSRLAAAEQAGFVVVPVGALSQAHARELVVERHPGLAPEAQDRVLAEARGNPLFLEELAAGNGSLKRLALGLAARLLAQPRTVRHAVARVAMLGRPAEPDLVGAGGQDALEADLLVARAGHMELRHELLGASAMQGLTAEAQRTLHSELAEGIADPGEAARHHAEAGEVQIAHAKACQAAAQSSHPGQRAGNLVVAAATAPAADRAARSLEAVEALIAVGEYAEALRLASAVETTNVSLRARVQLHLARARWELGEQDPAEAHAERGLALLAGSSDPLEVDLRLLLAQFALWSWNSERAMILAQQVLELALQRGHQVPRARHVLAQAHYIAGAADSPRRAREALDAVRGSGENALECEAGALLATALGAFGRKREARETAAEMAARAHELGLRGRELELRALGAQQQLMMEGPVDAVVECYRALLSEPGGLGVLVPRVEAELALSLALRGQDRDARDLLDGARAPGHSLDVSAYLDWVQAEVDWLAGRSRHALRRGVELVALGPPMSDAGVPVAGWAALDVGGPPQEPVRSALYPTEAAVVPETQALAKMWEGDHEGAADLFATAAEGWAGKMVWSEVRSLWGAGEAARRAGLTRQARRHLDSAAERAERHLLAPLAARVARSMRMIPGGTAGSPTQVRPAGALSRREREVLQLVGAGLTSPEIAAKLGLARSTVDTHVKSAVAKLGARNRTQAASSVSGAPD